MALLLNAYEQDDVLTCERIIGQHKREITGDPFIATCVHAVFMPMLGITSDGWVRGVLTACRYIQSMLMTIRGQVLLNKIQPYNRLKISFLSKVRDAHCLVLQWLTPCSSSTCRVMRSRI